MSATFYTVLFSFTKIAAEGLPPLSHQNLISVNNGLIENLHEIFDAQIWKKVPSPQTPNSKPFSCFVCRLPSVVCCLLSVVCRVSSVVSLLSYVVCRMSSVVCRLMSIVCRLSSAVYRLLSVVCRLSSGVCRLSSVVYRLSFVFHYHQVNHQLN
jgi:hypothetical protein